MVACLVKLWGIKNTWLKIRHPLTSLVERFEPSWPIMIRLHQANSPLDIDRLIWDPSINSLLNFHVGHLLWKHRQTIDWQVNIWLTNNLFFYLRRTLLYLWFSDHCKLNQRCALWLSFHMQLHTIAQECTHILVNNNRHAHDLPFSAFVFGLRVLSTET